MDRTWVELTGNPQDSLPGLNLGYHQKKGRTKTAPVTFKTWAKEPIARGD